MQVTERLDVEHRFFLHQLDDVADGVRAGVTPQAWRTAARTFVRMFRLHVSLEEHVVFPALAEARPEWSGLVAELESEHRLIERLAAGVERDAGGPATLEWIELLRTHFEKETYVAFPLAEESLPASRLRLARVDLVAGLSVPRERRRGDWPEHWLG